MMWLAEFALSAVLAVPGMWWLEHRATWPRAPFDRGLAAGVLLGVSVRLTALLLGSAL